MENERTDRILGITRCARCGHRLEGGIECPFCAVFPGPPKKQRIPGWIYITACFLTSPLSLYSLVRSKRLNLFEKALTSAGCVMWLVFYVLLVSG